MFKMEQDLSELKDKLNTLLEKWKILTELNNSNVSGSLLFIFKNILADLIVEL